MADPSPSPRTARGSPAPEAEKCPECGAVGTVSFLRRPDEPPSDPPDIDPLERLWPLLDAWSNHLAAKESSDKTIEQYEGYLIRLWRRTRTGPETLTEEIAESFLANVDAKGSTRQAYINAGKSFYRWALKRRRLDRDDNPCIDLTTKPPKYPPPDHYTKAEYRAILAATAMRRPASRRWALQLLLETGTRIDSLAHVTPADTGRSPGEEIRFRIAKNDRPYAVKLTPAAAEAVHELLALMRPDQETLLGCSKNTLGRWHKEAAIDAGLPPGRQHAHLLRHTAAVELYRRTKDPLLVRKFLNHADLSTVHRYADVVDEDMAAALADSLFD